MSVSSIRPTDRYADAHDTSSQQPEPKRPVEFDFAGAAYSHTTIPHGLIAASTTRATVAADWSAVEKKAGDVKRDLQTPAMRDLFAKTKSATWTMQKIEAKIGGALMLVALFKDKGVAALLSVPGALGSLTGVVDDIGALPQQIRDAFGAAHAAHPDAVQLERDLRDLAGALSTLATDAKRLAGF